MKRTKERYDKVLDPYHKLEGLSGCISFPGEDLGTKFYLAQAYFFRLCFQKKILKRSLKVMA